MKFCSLQFEASRWKPRKTWLLIPFKPLLASCTTVPGPPLTSGPMTCMMAERGPCSELLLRMEAATPSEELRRLFSVLERPRRGPAGHGTAARHAAHEHTPLNTRALTQPVQRTVSGSDRLAPHAGCIMSKAAGISVHAKKGSSRLYSDPFCSLR